MVELRLVERGKHCVLQWRRVKVTETLIDGQFVARLETTSFPRALAWSEWEEVPTVTEKGDSK